MHNHLITIVLWSTLMLVLCVAVHGFGLFSLNQAMRTEANVERMRRMTPLSLRGAAFTLAVVLALFVIHGLEIWAYALFYLGVGATGNLIDALYFSTISYSTVGYDDALISKEWRMIGAFESILGMIMIGWSTAFFFRLIGRIEGD